MKRRSAWLKTSGPLWLMFLPYAAGVFLFRAWGGVDVQADLPRLLLLPLLTALASASFYGPLLTPILFLTIGYSAAALLSGASFFSPSALQSLRRAAFWLPWIPALFCSARLGLAGVGGLLDASSPRALTPVRAGLSICSLQIVFFLSAAVCSRVLR